MCNCPPILRYSVACSGGYTKVSYHSSLVIQLLTLHQEFNLACLLFHTQLNVVVVIIKCEYLVYAPTCNCLLWCKLSADYIGKHKACAIDITMHLHLHSYSVAHFLIYLFKTLQCTQLYAKVHETLK